MTESAGRALGLDLGEERIGVAITDAARTVATPLEVIPARDRAAADTRITELIDEWEIGVVVVGMPYGLDGNEGPAARRTHAVVKRLGATQSVPFVTYDERLTTVEAHRILDEQQVPGRDRRAMVDMVAAQVILQGWIEKTRHG